MGKRGEIISENQIKIKMNYIQNLYASMYDPRTCLDNTQPKYVHIFSNRFYIVLILYFYCSNREHKILLINVESFKVFNKYSTNQPTITTYNIPNMEYQN